MEHVNNTGATQSHTPFPRAIARQRDAFRALAHHERKDELDVHREAPHEAVRGGFEVQRLRHGYTAST